MSAFSLLAVVSGTWRKFSIRHTVFFPLPSKRKDFINKVIIFFYLTLLMNGSDYRIPLFFLNAVIRAQVDMAVHGPARRRVKLLRGL